MSHLLPLHPLDRRRQHLRVADTLAELRQAAQRQHLGAAEILSLLSRREADERTAAHLLSVAYLEVDDD